MNSVGDKPDKPRIALLFRYGPAEHTELFHAMPNIVEALAQELEVHYFGLKSKRPIPDTIQANAQVHQLPLYVDRTSTADKLWKTFIWLLWLPWIGLWCRWHRVRAMYIDETIPLTAPLARIFFGPRVAITVADFFMDIYAEQYRWLLWTGGWVKRADLWAWRRLPLLFTRARNTRTYLVARGVPAAHVHPVYDPCDLNRYYPMDQQAARAALGIADDAIVLVHHGILHPNKGNHRILEAIAASRDQFPRLLYLLIGDGPDMPRLRKQVRDLGLEQQVKFTGWLETLEEVNQALNAGDIGLVMRIGQPSDDFHMTGALVHSMACGLPILAARLAGVAEVVQDDVNGYLFDPHTLNDFPAQLHRLYNDPALRKKLGDQALTDAREHFDLDAVTRQTVKPLLDLCRDATGYRPNTG